MRLIRWLRVVRTMIRSFTVVKTSTIPFARSMMETSPSSRVYTSSATAQVSQEACLRVVLWDCMSAIRLPRVLLSKGNCLGVNTMIDCLDALYQQDEDHVVLVNTSLTHMYSVIVEMTIETPDGRKVCTIRRRMNALCGETLEVWELPAPYEPFVLSFSLLNDPTHSSRNIGHCSLWW